MITKTNPTDNSEEADTAKEEGQQRAEEQTDILVEVGGFPGPMGIWCMWRGLVLES